MLVTGRCSHLFASTAGSSMSQTAWPSCFLLRLWWIISILGWSAGMVNPTYHYSHADGLSLFYQFYESIHAVASGLAWIATENCSWVALWPLHRSFGPFNWRTGKLEADCFSRAKMPYCMLQFWGHKILKTFQKHPKPQELYDGGDCCCFKRKA